MEQFWSVLFFIGHIILFSITKIVYFEFKKIFEILKKPTQSVFIYYR